MTEADREARDRETFETWISSQRRHRPYSLEWREENEYTGWPRDSYVDDDVDLAWRAWRASREEIRRSVVEVRELVGRICPPSGDDD